MSRAWSHWPTKFRTNSSDRGSASIRSTWACRFVAQLVLARPGGTARRRASTTRGSTTAARPGRIRRRADTGPAIPARSPPRGRGTAARPAPPPSPGRRPPRTSARPGPTTASASADEPVHRRVVHRPAEGPRGEPAQELAGVAPASGGVRGHVAGEEPVVVRRPDPVLARPSARGPSPTGSGSPATGPASRPGVSGSTSNVSVVRRRPSSRGRTRSGTACRPAGRTPARAAPRRRPGRRAGTRL